MKRKDVTKTKGPIEKKSGFHYVPGNICSLREPSLEEEHWEKSQEHADLVSQGCCPRDGGGFEKDPDGRIVCQGCGLVWTEELEKRYGKPMVGVNL